MENNLKSLGVGESFTFKNATPYSISYLDQTVIIEWECVGCTVVGHTYDMYSGFGRYWAIDTEYPFTSSMALLFAYNSSNIQRQATINILVKSNSTNEIVAYPFTVVQNSGKELFEISTENVSTSYLGETKRISYKCSLDRDLQPRVTSSASWLSCAIERFGLNSNIVITTTENDTFHNREGYITVEFSSEQEGMFKLNYSKVITVTQGQNQNAPSFNILTDEPIQLPSDGRNSISVPFSLVNTAKIISSTTDDTFFTYIVDKNSNVILISPAKENFTEAKYRGKISLLIGSDYPDYPQMTYELMVEQEKMELLFNPTSLLFDYKGKVVDGSDYATTLDSQGYKVVTITNSDNVTWITRKLDTTTKTFYVNSVFENVTTDVRSFDFTFNVILDTTHGRVTTKSKVTVIQEASPENIEAPIWKDTILTLSKETFGDNKYYRLFNNNTDEEIYRGQLYFLKDNLEINVSDIAKDYININKYPFNNTLTNNDGYVNFAFDISNDGITFTTIQVFHFYYNYDYDYGKTIYDLRQASITDPIQDYADARQYILWSFQDFYSTQVSTASSTPVIVTCEYWSKTTNTTYNLTNTQNTICIRPRMMNSVTFTTVGTHTVEVKETCADYCLYYINRMGGWSWLLINGNDIKNNKITTKSYNKYSTNSLSSNFQNTSYLKEIKESWKLNTEYLTDEQSEKMEDLLTSPVVYLHILNDDRLIAVNINETSVDVKTFVNQKNKPYQYSFTVENSQTKYRR